MSASIESVTIGAVTEGRLLLTQSAAARILSIGNDWTHLRIGMRFAIGDPGASLTGTPRFYMGLLSNPTADVSNGPQTAQTSHFLGIVSDVATWTRFAGPPVNLSLGVSASYVVRVGNTSTKGGSTNPPLVVSGTPGSLRYAIVLVIHKGTDGGADWKMGIVYPVGGATDASYEDLTNALEADTQETDFSTQLVSIQDSFIADIGTGLHGRVELSTTLTVDEGVNGILNALCLAWDRTVPLYVSELLFVKTL